jgi:hypothetical protein
MRLMLAAARTEFIQLESARIVPAVLVRQVGTFPAFVTRQGDEDSIFALFRHVL